MGERCFWCNTDPDEAAARFEGPHAKWCLQYRTPVTTVIELEKWPDKSVVSMVTTYQDPEDLAHIEYEPLPDEERDYLERDYLSKEEQYRLMYGDGTPSPRGLAKTAQERAAEYASRNAGVNTRQVRRARQRAADKGRTA